MRESNSWTRRGLEGGRHWSVCKLRVAGPPCHWLPVAVLSCLYYLRLEVEKLDLRVVPACFFFFFLLHTALCTPDHAKAYLKPAWWQGELENRRMCGGGGREYSVLFHSHLHSGFSCLFQPPPAEPFELPEIRVIKLFPEVRPQMPGACFLHVNVYVTHVHTETHAKNCVTLLGHSVK